MSTLPPLRREVVVDLSANEAFDLFTDHIGDWWPIAQLGVFGAGAAVAFKDGRLVETMKDQTTEWGSVTTWEPPQRVSFTWHPGAPAQKASRVSVSFVQQGPDRTLVVLEHSGWEVFDDPTAARSEYEKGWPTVLDRYQEATKPAAEHATYTWVALMHRPGPRAPHDRSIFDDPRFGEHVQFLSRLHQQGLLVAAGPMLDAVGEGMTILRLPGENRLEEAERLATTEDPSVRGGFFDVSVRPWRVLMSRELAGPDASRS